MRATEKIGGAFDTLGTALGTLTALGVFFSIVGYFVLRARLVGLGIDGEAGLLVIPREQIALAGIREIVLSGAFALVLLGLSGLFVARLAKAMSGEEQDRARGPVTRADLRKRFALVPFLVLCLLLPISVPGALAALTFVLLFFAVKKFAPESPGSFREFLNAAVVASVVLATLSLAVLRQFEFPTAFAPAAAVLAGGAEVRGALVSTSSDAVVLGNARVTPPPSSPALGPASETAAASAALPGPVADEAIPALALARDGVTGLRLGARDERVAPSPSAWARFAGWAGPRWLPRVTCFPPECRINKRLFGAAS
jgi:hypothetical protein